MSTRQRMVMPVSDELLADHHGGLGDMMRHLLEGGELPPPRPEPPTPAGHLALLDATDGTLRTVVELHAPRWDLGIRRCEGCDFDGYDGEPPIWPCRTIELVSEQLGIDLRQDT